MANLKKILVNIFLMIIILVIGYFLLEMVSARLIKDFKVDKKIEYMESKLNKNHMLNIGQFDKVLGWGYRPGAHDCIKTSEYDVCYSINSKGLRDEEVEFERKAGIFRILALGESNVFGESVSYGLRFTDIAEKAIKNTEVINAGVQGYGMDQSFLYLKKEGFKYKPDLVVLFVIEDFISRCKNGHRGVNMVKPRFILSADKKSLVFQDYSYVKNNYIHLSESRNNTSEYPATRVKEEKNKRLFKKSNIVTLFEFYKSKQNIDRQLKNADREFWKSVRMDIKSSNEIVDEYSKDDFEQLIFLLLFEYAKLCQEHDMDFLIINVENRQIKYLDEFCAKLGIPYLDLSKILVSASQFKSLRFDIDPHYNEFAHRVIGEYVANYIIKRRKLTGNHDFKFEFLNKF